MLGRLLHLRQNLDGRRPCSDESNSFVSEICCIVPIGAMKEFALEIVKSWYGWPLPVVEKASCIDQNMAPVFDHDPVLVYFHVV